MTNHFGYYAVLYAYSEDGSEKVRMPCFTEEKAMAAASRHPKVRVVKEGMAPFWLSLTEKERKKYVLAEPDDIAPELLRGPAEDNPETLESNGVRDHRQQSDIFYDGWRTKKHKMQF